MHTSNHLSLEYIFGQPDQGCDLPLLCSDSQERVVCTVQCECKSQALIVLGFTPHFAAPII